MRSLGYRAAPRLLAAALATALACAAPAGAADGAHGRPLAHVALGSDPSCAQGDMAPTRDNLADVEAVTLCLLNAQRAARGLGPLRRNGRLDVAAARHSRDMVARRFFAHVTPTGVDVVARLTRSGYVLPGISWSVGENIAWGSGTRGVPLRIVQAWMASPGHRANILSAGYRELGLGVVVGAPVAGAPGAVTYTTDFGVRSGVAVRARRGRPTRGRKARSTLRRAELLTVTR